GSTCSTRTSYGIDESLMRRPARLVSARLMCMAGIAAPDDPVRTPRRSKVSQEYRALAMLRTGEVEPSKLWPNPVHLAFRICRGRSLELPEAHRPMLATA